MFSDWNILLIFIPIILGFSISSLFTMNRNNLSKKTEPKPHWQPPGYVFSLVWSILYLLSGIVLYYITVNKSISSCAYKWLLFLVISQIVLENAWVIYTSYIEESDFNQLLIIWFLVAVILAKIISLSYVGESRGALLSSFEIMWLAIAISLL